MALCEMSWDRIDERHRNAAEKGYEMLLLLVALLASGWNGQMDGWMEGPNMFDEGEIVLLLLGPFNKTYTTRNWSLIVQSHA